MQDERYSRVAVVLHWTIATLIVFNLCVGFFMEGLSAPLRILVVGLHVSSGLTVLALTLIRIMWRILHEPPPHQPALKPWERQTSRFVHFFLYVAMVLMPLTGWSIVSAHPPPGSAGAAAAAMSGPKPALPAGPGGAIAGPPKGVMKIWGALPLPPVTPIEAIGADAGAVKTQHKLHDEFVAWHSVGAFVLIALLLMHVAGALKHQFIDKQAMLSRMGIGGRR